MIVSIQIITSVKNNDHFAVHLQPHSFEAQRWQDRALLAEKTLEEERVKRALEMERAERAERALEVERVEREKQALLLEWTEWEALSKRYGGGGLVAAHGG